MVDRLLTGVAMCGHGYTIANLTADFVTSWLASIAWVLQLCTSRYSRKNISLRLYCTYVLGVVPPVWRVDMIPLKGLFPMRTFHLRALFAARMHTLLYGVRRQICKRPASALIIECCANTDLARVWKHLDLDACNSEGRPKNLGLPWS